MSTPRVEVSSRRGETPFANTSLPRQKYARVKPISRSLTCENENIKHRTPATKWHITPLRLKASVERLSQPRRNALEDPTDVSAVQKCNAAAPRPIGRPNISRLVRHIDSNTTSSKHGSLSYHARKAENLYSRTQAYKTVHCPRPDPPHSRARKVSEPITIIQVDNDISFHQIDMDSAKENRPKSPTEQYKSISELLPGSEPLSINGNLNSRSSSRTVTGRASQRARLNNEGLAASNQANSTAPVNAFLSYQSQAQRALEKDLRCSSERFDNTIQPLSNEQIDRATKCSTGLMTRRNTSSRAYEELLNGQSRCGLECTAAPSASHAHQNLHQNVIGEHIGLANGRTVSSGKYNAQLMQENKEVHVINAELREKNAALQKDKSDLEKESSEKQKSVTELQDKYDNLRVNYGSLAGTLDDFHQTKIVDDDRLQNLVYENAKLTNANLELDKDLVDVRLARNKQQQNNVRLHQEFEANRQIWDDWHRNDLTRIATLEQEAADLFNSQQATQSVREVLAGTDALVHRLGRIEMDSRPVQHDALEQAHRALEAERELHRLAQTAAASWKVAYETAYDLREDSRHNLRQWKIAYQRVQTALIRAVRIHEDEITLIRQALEDEKQAHQATKVKCNDAFEGLFQMYQNTSNSHRETFSSGSDTINGNTADENTAVAIDINNAGTESDNTDKGIDNSNDGSSVGSSVSGATHHQEFVDNDGEQEFLLGPEPDNLMTDDEFDLELASYSEHIEFMQEDDDIELEVSDLDLQNALG